MGEATFLTLTALTNEPLHGYALLKEVDRLAERGPGMHVGTLYAVLDRLAREGLVTIAAEEVVGGKLRRTYQLTVPGIQALADETARMETLARAARTRLGRLPTAIAWESGT